MASKFEGGSAAERTGEKEQNPKAPELGKAALAAILKQTGMSLNELIARGATIQGEDGSAFDLSEVTAGGDGSNISVVETGERLVGADGNTYRHVNMYEVVGANAPEAANATEINVGNIKTENEAMESSETKEISEDEYYKEGFKVLPLSCFKKFSGQLGLSEELLKKGFRGMAEWPTEAKKKYFELAQEANPDADYTAVLEKKLAEGGKHYTAEKADEDSEDGGKDDAEKAENKESFIAKMKKFGRSALKALGERIGIKPFKEWDPKTQRWVKRAMAIGSVALVGLTLASTLRKGPEKMAPGVDTYYTEDANDQDVDDTLANFETAGGVFTTAIEGQEKQENKEAIPAKTNWEASTYMHRGADGKLTPDAVISPDENGNYNDVEGKRSKWNIASLPEYTAKFAAENGLDANDLETKKAAFKSLVKEGPEYTAMFLYNAREEGCEGCDVFKGNPESIKVALQQNEKAREEAAKLVDKIIDGSAITEDVLKTGRYFNSYFAEQPDGVHIIEQGVDAAYYQLTDGESDNAKVFKLTYTDEHGETKAFYVKQVCGQLVREGAWFDHEETPDTTTTTETSTDTTTTSTETTTTSTETSTDTTTTSTETTTTSTETSTDTTTTSTETSTTPTDTTTTKTETSTTPTNTTTKIETTTQPKVTTTEAKTTQPNTTTKIETTTQPKVTTTEAKTTQPNTTTKIETTTQPKVTTTEAKTTQPNTTTKIETTTQPKVTTTEKVTTTQPVNTTENITSQPTTEQTTPVTTTAPVVSQPEVSSGPATGTTFEVTNQAKNEDEAVFNFDVKPGGDETAYEPPTFSETTYTTAADLETTPEDISDYDSTDANGNPTNTDYSQFIETPYVDWNGNQEAEDAAAKDPTNGGGAGDTPPEDFFQLPPEFGSEDDDNNLGIFGN